MIRSAFHELYKWIENMDLQRKLTIMSSVIIVPFVGIILFLLVMFGRYGDSYDGIVRNVTLVNDYNIRFKEDMDSVMYQMVARSLGSEEVEEAIGMKNPERMIDEAEAGFEQLEQSSTSQQASQVSSHVLKLLGTLRKHVENISSTVKVSGSYEENMVKLDNDIRIITELIQERIAEYLSYETVSMEQVRQNMVASRIGLIRAAVITLLLLIAVAIVFAALIMRSITRPIRQLCDASEQIGKGHFDTRINIAARNELSLLGNSFNHMSEQITVLIEDIPFSLQHAGQYYLAFPGGQEGRRCFPGHVPFPLFPHNPVRRTGYHTPERGDFPCGSLPADPAVPLPRHSLLPHRAPAGADGSAGH